MSEQTVHVEGEILLSKWEKHGEEESKKVVMKGCGGDRVAHPPLDPKCVRGTYSLSSSSHCQSVDQRHIANDTSARWDSHGFRYTWKRDSNLPSYGTIYYVPPSWVTRSKAPYIRGGYLRDPSISLIDSFSHAPSQPAMFASCSRFPNQFTCSEAQPALYF